MMSSRLRKPPFDLETFLSRTGPGKAVLKFSKGEHVFRQGDVADAVFYIQSGTIKVTVVSPHGKEAVIALLEAGQFLGEGCLHGEGIYAAKIIADTTMTLTFAANTICCGTHRCPCAPQAQKDSSSDIALRTFRQSHLALKDRLIASYPEQACSAFDLCRLGASERKPGDLPDVSMPRPRP